MPPAHATGDQELAKALIDAGESPVCGFPPLTRRFRVDHREASQIARCLNSKGHLSDEALARLTADPSFAVTGSWDGPPGDSGFSWRSPGSSDTVFSVEEIETRSLTRWVVLGYIAFGVVVAMLVWWVRLRRRNRSAS